MQCTIAKATPSDIGDIMRIENACFPEGTRESESTFLGRISAFSSGFTLLSPGPVGYFSSEIWNEIPPPEKERWALGHSAAHAHTTDGTILYVSSFAIVPGARGGTGRFFFNASIELILRENPRIERITFIVNESWLPARHIYETEGFAYTDSIPDFFEPARRGGPRETALIMERQA